MTQTSSETSRKDNKVHKRVLGKSGLNSSEVGLGCWQFGGDFGPITESEVSAILDDAINCGVNFWDTADVYGAGQSETYIGNYLQAHPELKQGENKVVVATKLGRSAELYPNNYSKADMRQSIEKSLKRLQVDCLDLIQLHCIPPGYLKDKTVFKDLDELKQEGLIHAYGASVETIEEAQLCLQHEGLSSLQMIINVFRQDAVSKIFEQAQNSQVGIIARLPLASGLLAGKYTKDTRFTEQDHRNYNCDGQMFNVGETFSGLPFRTGIELVNELKSLMPTEQELATNCLRWLLDHDAVTSVIAGVSKAGQLGRNAKASSLPHLSEELHERLHEFYKNKVRPLVRGDI
ncbi:aldo/keto reductase [Agaribacterium sp. ZY112]|uniref:aldo/keto reductase n=1 Tax=Agaribacterium sp. ZY112 TaxID=3233574 RepID=UPI003525EC32